MSLTEGIDVVVNSVYYNFLESEDEQTGAFVQCICPWRILDKNNINNKWGKHKKKIL